MSIHCSCFPDITEATMRDLIREMMEATGRKPTPEEVEFERDERFTDGKSHCATCLDYRIPTLIDEEWAAYTAKIAIAAE